MRYSFLLSVVSLLAFSVIVGQCSTKARDANPVARSGRSIAAGAYVSAALQSYGPITATHVTSEKDVQLGVYVYPGRKFDIVYLSTLYALQVPMHHQALRPIVPFAAAELTLEPGGAASAERASMLRTIESIIARRTTDALGLDEKPRKTTHGKKKGRRNGSTTHMRAGEPTTLKAGLKEVRDCARALIESNARGIAALTNEIDRFPRWEWGAPLNEDIPVLRHAIADAFLVHPPTLAPADARAPGWCTKP